MSLFLLLAVTGRVLSIAAHSGVYLSDPDLSYPKVIHSGIFRPERPEVYLQKNDPENAVTWAAKALEKRSNFEPGWRILVRALYHKGEYSRVWDEIRSGQKYGFQADPDLLRTLSERMPAPASSKR